MATQVTTAKSPALVVSATWFSTHKPIAMSSHEAVLLGEADILLLAIENEKPRPLIPCRSMGIAISFNILLWVLFLL